MESKEKIEIRNLKNGDWYWIDKAILYVHGRKLKPSGIAVYNALASFANSRTQVCFPAQRAMAELIGVSRRTVMRKIKTLQELGLIRVEKRKGVCIYYLCKPRSLVTKKTQGCDKSSTSEVTPGSINNNKLTRINNKNIDSKKILNSDAEALKRFKPKTREELLALDLALALNDPPGLPLYLSYSRKYPESFLRRVLGEVKELPSEKIKKSRGALFNHLVQKYAGNTTKNLGA